MKQSSVSFEKWLEEQGVRGALENAEAHNKHQAKNVFFFDSEEAAKNFRRDHLRGDQFGGAFFDSRVDSWAMPINSAAQEQLKKEFLEKHPKPEQTPEEQLAECEKQLKLVKAARYKIKNFNRHVEISHERGEAPRGVPDRLQKMANLLRNNDEGWVFSQAATTFDIALAAYTALNYDCYSEETLALLAATQRHMIQVNEQGIITGGLKADANLLQYMQEELMPMESLTQQQNAQRRDHRRQMIRENVHNVLYGGEERVIDKNTPAGVTTLKSGQPVKTHPRFMPDQDGKSEVDTVVLQGGGMRGHSSMRILKKEKDDSVPGGYRFYLTKLDAGAGLEDHKHNMASGIYTTEIKPYFALDANGRIMTGHDGSPVLLSDEGRQQLDADPKLYAKHMEAVVFALVDAERQILYYKNPKIDGVDHGENKGGVSASDAREWNFWNNRINGLRGDKVPERCKKTTIQKSGNCSVFSGMLVITELVGDVLGYDIMQSAKSYNGSDTDNKLSAKEAELEARKEKLQAIIDAKKAPPPGTTPVKIYSAATDEQNPGRRVAVAFENAKARDAFIAEFTAKAAEKRVDTSKMFGTYGTTLYVNSSSGVGSLGTYESTNGELSVNFNNPELNKVFMEMLGLTAEQAHTAGNALYIRTTALSPEPDPKRKAHIAAHAKFDMDFKAPTAPIPKPVDDPPLPATPKNELPEAPKQPELKVDESKKGDLQAEIDKKAVKLIHDMCKNSQNKQFFSVAVIEELEKALPADRGFTNDEERLLKHNLSEIFDSIQVEKGKMEKEKAQMGLIAKFIDLVKSIFGHGVYNDFIENVSNTLKDKAIGDFTANELKRRDDAAAKKGVAQNSP